MYLLTIRWANSPGPGRPLAIGSTGFGAAITTASLRGGTPAAGGSGQSDSALAPSAVAGGCSGAADMEVASGPGAAGGNGTVAPCGRQHGQAYLWTKCSITRKEAGRYSSCSLLSTPISTRS